MAELPNALRRNGLASRNVGNDAAVGKALIEYMLGRLGLSNLSGLTVLDIGCGVRFAEAIKTYQLEFARYIGIELDSETIAYLKATYTGPQFDFHKANQANAFYNPGGGDDFAKLADTLAGQAGLVSMFSVITHQNPEEAQKSFHLAHKAATPGGKLFFTALIHGQGHAPFEMENPRGHTFDNVSEAAKQALKTKAEAGQTYFEWDPDRPGFMSGYAQDYLSELAESCGWKVVSIEAPWANDLPIQTSFLCERV